MVAAIRKALVPIVVSLLAVLADKLGADIPGDTLQQIAAGLVNAVLVYAVKNG